MAIQWKVLPIAAALLMGLWGADFAAATPDPLGPDIGDVNFTLSIYPAAPSVPNGGGPFQLTINTITTNPVANLGIPKSVQGWCVEISEHISPGGTYTADLLREGPSKIGGLIQDGLKWLNITNSGISFKSGFSGFGFAPPSWTWWNDPTAVAAAIQNAIWSLQLNTPIPTTIGTHNDANVFIASLINYAATASYYRLHIVGVQDEVFGVPGPMAGAGIPGLLLAFGIFVLWVRRRQKIA
jgi:hypothetical protein